MIELLAETSTAVQIADRIVAAVVFIAVLGFIAYTITRI